MRRREFLALCSTPALVRDSMWPTVDSGIDNGRFLGNAPLGRLDRQPPPFHRLLSSGLNARLFTDLSTVTADDPIIPNARFFVRTSCPPEVPGSGEWTIRIGGLARTPRTIRLTSLQPLVRPAGTHVIECSGNSDPTNFGLMSEAAWDGVPLAQWLATLGATSSARSVLVSGADYDASTPTSIAGASWIFRIADLKGAGAFLALGMNGATLPRDHGFPVRLVVPGWYGCASIKWVNQIDFVGDDSPATSQMREFAARTHQNGVPTAAREYEPAHIDHAAMPIRVERWSVAGRLVCRVIGVLWGGRRPTNQLLIRFSGGAPFEPVRDCPMPVSTTRWTVWTHPWRPATPGTYRIVLRLRDQALSARRLDRGFYTREVRIDEI